MELHYYNGNTAALSAIGILRSRELKAEDKDAQLDLIEEEIIQLRSFINRLHPENNLPLSLRKNG